MYGFDSDRLDWNFANLQATIYNTNPHITRTKNAKDFLLQFDSEREQSEGEFWGAMKLFATQHNALVKGK